MHPDVLYFKEGWNGYKFWMAYTPYPYGNGLKENPSIVASNDGITWEVPAGLTNPLQSPPTGISINNYHYSDPELFYEEPYLYIIYRAVYSPIVKEVLYMQKSLNGVEWDSPVILYTLPTKKSLLSPTLIKLNGEYRLYIVGTGLGYYTSNSIKGPYSGGNSGGNSLFVLPGTSLKPVICTVEGVPTGKSIWHINITPYGNQYIGAFTLTDNTGYSLYIARSWDGNTWKMVSTPLLEPYTPHMGEDWQSWMIYRSSLVFVDREMWLYYSASSLQDHSWHTGLTKYHDGSIPHIKKITAKEV